MLKTGEVAALTGISIRTLHHYDEIGLLTPSGRSEAGYRLYSRTDLERLQTILFYRELEFSLENIQRLLSAPDFNRLNALKQQRELMQQRRDQLGKVLALIEQSIRDIYEDTKMGLKEMFEVFPDITPDMIMEEEQKWGHTDAYQESRRRASQYSKTDWEQIKSEGEACEQAQVDAYRQGLSPDSPQAGAVIEAARQHICKWHFDCSRELYANITEMTRQDERYHKELEAANPGLKDFIAAAARANTGQQ